MEDSLSIKKQTIDEQFLGNLRSRFEYSESFTYLLLNNAGGQDASPYSCLGLKICIRFAPSQYK